MTTTPFSANIEEITPEIAKAYLELNRNNRKISEKGVVPIAQDLINGNWKMTGEAIKFDADNNLLDGQHRLTAIQRTGIPMSTLVIRGVEPEAQLVLDTGMKRTGANALEIAHTGHEATLRSAIAAVGLTDDAGRLTHSNSPLLPATHSQIIQWVKANNLDNAIFYGAKVHRLLRGSKSAFCYAYYKIAKIDEASAQRFFDDIADLSTTGPGDPKHTLVNKINKNRDYFRGTGYRSKYIYHFLRAWEAEYLNQELRLIRDTIRGKAIEMPDLSRFMNIPDAND